MKIDKSYNSLFNSLGAAITTCTLLVSIGKNSSEYYFFILMLAFVLIVFLLSLCDYYRQQKGAPPVSNTTPMAQYEMACSPIRREKRLSLAYCGVYSRASSLDDSECKEILKRRRKTSLGCFPPKRHSQGNILETKSFKPQGNLFEYKRFSQGSSESKRSFLQGNSSNSEGSRNNSQGNLLDVKTTSETKSPKKKGSCNLLEELQRFKLRRRSSVGKLTIKERRKILERSGTII